MWSKEIKKRMMIIRRMKTKQGSKEMVGRKEEEQHERRMRKEGRNE